MGKGKARPGEPSWNYVGQFGEKVQKDDSPKKPNELLDPERIVPGSPNWSWEISRKHLAQKKAAEQQQRQEKAAESSPDTSMTLK